MPDHLTDEQLTELERLSDEDRRLGVFVHPDYARAAREAVPALIAEVRALRKENAALRERINEWEDRYSNLLRQYEALLRGITVRVKESEGRSA